MQPSNNRPMFTLTGNILTDTFPYHSWVALQPNKSTLLQENAGNMSFRLPFLRLVAHHLECSIFAPRCEMSLHVATFMCCIVAFVVPTAYPHRACHTWPCRQHCEGNDIRCLNAHAVPQLTNMLHAVNMSNARNSAKCLATM